jgi:prepilin-type N-terminal cleavage/methylation domain-containing protein
MKARSGFTLVEITIAVMLIALLAILAIPAIMNARERSRNSVCISMLRQLDSAKAQYALEYNMGENETVTVTDIDDYVKGLAGNLDDLCPAGGVYTLGVMAVEPTCNLRVPEISWHSL